MRLRAGYGCRDGISSGFSLRGHRALVSTAGWQDCGGGVVGKELQVGERLRFSVSHVVWCL